MEDRCRNVGTVKQVFSEMRKVQFVSEYKGKLYKKEIISQLQYIR